MTYQKTSQQGAFEGLGLLVEYPTGAWKESARLLVRQLVYGLLLDIDSKARGCDGPLGKFVNIGMRRTGSYG